MPSIYPTDLDGLAGGTTLLCCAALALLEQNWDVRFVETVGGRADGRDPGFLRFNTHPARIFMGDAGSQFLGFSVGVLSILLTKQTATPLSTALPLLLVGLPMLDTLTVMVLRLHAGRSPFAADRNHFHHRLLAPGARSSRGGDRDLRGAVRIVVAGLAIAL